MGCGGSKASGPPAPAGAPADWKAQVEAVFKLLDKNGTGYIDTVPHKKRDEKFSEILVLGDAVVAAQLAAGDFTLDHPSMSEFVAAVQKGAEAQGWAPVGDLLAKITSAVEGDETKGGWQDLARNVFKKLDSKWCEPADTGSVDIVAELKGLGDKTDIKTATIASGLTEGTKIACDDFVTHVGTKVEPAGWPRVKKELMVIHARLEKVAELDDFGGM